MRFSNNQKEINSFIEKAFDLGINYFESGSFYIESNCENLLGTALKSYSHNFFYLAAKFSFVNFLESKLTLEDYFNIQLEKHQIDNNQTIGTVEANPSTEMYKVVDYLIKNG